MKKNYIAKGAVLLALGFTLGGAGCNAQSYTQNIMQNSENKTVVTTTPLSVTGVQSNASVEFVKPIAQQVQFQPRAIQTDGPKAVEGGVAYSAELWQAPKFSYEPSLDVGAGDVEGVKGLFFNSPVKYNGKQTKIAAYIGFPEGASSENKVPAIVLVHGGEGTAIPEWVRYWNKQGFAAISLDTEGAEPIIGVSNYKNYHVKNRYKNDEVYTAGPSNAGFTDCGNPLEEQWMYHATSATILATSLLASFDCVDQQKIGITGVSWGSVITTIVCAYDDRLTFAMPVYGAATLTENDGFVKFGKNTESVNTALQYWNVSTALQNTNCKMFYVAAQTGDTAFSVNVANEAAALTNGLTLFKDGFTHSQESGANEKNLPEFAKLCCGMQMDFVEITEQPTKENLAFRYTSYGDVSIKSITVCYTTKTALTTKVEWVQRTETINGGSSLYNISVPSDATYAFARIKYNDGKEVSTRIVALK